MKYNLTKNHSTQQLSVLAVRSTKPERGVEQTGVNNYGD